MAPHSEAPATLPNGHAVAVSTRPRDDRPLAVRLGEFTVERFPPLPQMLLLAIVYAAVLGLARAQGGADRDGIGRAVVGLAVLVVFTFRMRVFDDRKDADTDRITEPDRPIPRGLVQESELDALSIAMLVVEGLAVSTIGHAALLAWATAAAYTCLMRVEFFAGAWLDTRPWPYAISHMASMGLTIVMLFAFAHDAFGSSIGMGGVVVWTAVAAFCFGLAAELGRKWERYVSGHPRHAVVWWLVLPLVGGGLLASVSVSVTRHGFTVAQQLVSGVPIGLVVIGLALRGWSAVSDGARAPDKAARTWIEIVPGLGMLAAFLIIAIVAWSAA